MPIVCHEAIHDRTDWRQRCESDHATEDRPRKTTRTEGSRDRSMTAERLVAPEIDTLQPIRTLRRVQTE
jgi:hypothetical protein